ncbi:MAG: Hsp70 family protein, partial [Phaeodactylibacter sp.]|nr:Hsp70 family protein [Phaeodactylibacter sp.]
EMAVCNKSLGQFNLSDIPPAPRGMPHIELTFDIDANGILHVHAKDKGTGKEQSIRIEASTGLSKQEIERMRAEAQANAEADKEARERVEKLNAADTLIFQTDKQLKEYGDKIPADKKGAIETALNDLREAHKAEDLGKIDTASEALNQAWQAASQDLYQATQQAQAEPGNGGAGAQEGQASGGPGPDDVTDVEFEEVDEDKKK